MRRTRSFSDEPTPTNDVDQDETCEAIVNGWENRPVLHLTSETETRAYYRPSTDSVHMPARSRFVDTPQYYSTLFYELVHSSGHESRLNCPLDARFGEERYTKEELLAEMGAALLLSPHRTRRFRFDVLLPLFALLP